MKETLVRSISGIGLIAIMLVALTFSKYFFALFMLFIMVMMMLEFYRMTLHSRYTYSRILAILSAVVLFTLLFFACAFPNAIDMKVIALVLAPVIVLIINSIYENDVVGFKNFSHIFTGLMYIGVPLSLSNLVVFRHGEFNGTLMLAFFIIIWSSDVGGYICGMSLRNIFPKKLMPELSPKKTWIGFWGGVVLSVIAAVIMQLCGMLEVSMIHSVILAVIMSVTGVYGDLYESQWKRACCIKDSSKAIPGHGGFLDRFDSALIAIPAASLYLLLIDILQ